MQRLTKAAIILALSLLLSMPLPAAEQQLEVIIKTELGDIRLELNPGAAPVTVANFLRYVDAGHYRQAKFYRAVRTDNQPQQETQIEVIQGGLGIDDNPRPYPPIAHETTRQTGITHQNGVISMARLEPGTATSEFFICINDQPSLDFDGLRNPDGQGFAAFGRVIAGMDVVRAIQQAKTDQPKPGKMGYINGQMLLEPVLIRDIVRVGN